MIVFWLYLCFTQRPNCFGIGVDFYKPIVIFEGLQLLIIFLINNLNKSTNHFVYNVLEKSEHSLVSFFKSLRYNKDDFFVVSDQQSKTLK